MSKPLKFKDFGFKLAVLNKLMFEDNIIPKLDIEDYIEKHRGLKKGEGYDIIEEEGYEVIPEIKQYLENIEITEDMVKNITQLDSDGGDEIYSTMIPFWDGEDDVYDVKSAEDVKLLPNLKYATLIFEYDNEKLINEFEKLGVELESL